MTDVGIESEAMTLDTATVARRPYKPKEEKFDISHLDIRQLEKIVGRSALGFTLLGKWIVVDFGNVTVRFKQWRSV